MTTTITRTTTPPRAAAARTAERLASSSVRELVIALAELEDQLRGAAANERAVLARELAAVVHELRRRRQQMRALSRQRT